MKSFLVQVKYTTPKGVNITREFISTGEDSIEAASKVQHLLDDWKWMDNFSIISIEISAPYEIF